MTLPNFSVTGDLPPGIHRVTIGEVIQRFGAESGKRALVTQRLLHIYDLAKRTGHLGQFIIFGSYVSTKAEPNDVDVILVIKTPLSRASVLVSVLAYLIMQLHKRAMAQVYSGRVPVQCYWSR